MSGSEQSYPQMGISGTDSDPGIVLCPDQMQAVPGPAAAAAGSG